MTNLYRIRDKRKNLSLLKLNAIQSAMYEKVRDQQQLREYVLKYRQGGVSTFWILWWLDDCIFKENTITGILSHKQESLKYLWEIVRIAYDNMPDDYKPESTKYNESELSFAGTNSKIFVSLSIRSTAVHNLHVSEICHIDPNDLRASLATVGPDGNVTIESTANGVGNDGYTMFQDAKAGENGYRPHFYPWWIQPEYRLPLNGMTVTKSPEEAQLPIDDEQVLWRRSTKKTQKELFPQEFPEDEETAFLSTGNPYFDNKKVMALLKEARDLEKTQPPTISEYEFTQWEKPTKGHVYVAAADVAEGIDGDFSVLKIACVTCRQEAFRYRAHVAVDAFYKVLGDWCTRYNKCLLAVERNNHGHAVILGLHETIKYQNLYLQEKETRVIKDRGFRERKDIVKIGWDTTTITKPIMMDHLKQAVEGDSLDDVDNFQPEFLVRDIIFLQEALTFSQDGDKIGASEGKHDDDVIATAIMFQMYIKAKATLKLGANSGIHLGDTYEAAKII